MIGIATLAPDGNDSVITWCTPNMRHRADTGRADRCWRHCVEADASSRRYSVAGTCDFSRYTDAATSRDQRIRPFCRRWCGIIIAVLRRNRRSDLARSPRCCWQRRFLVAPPGRRRWHAHATRRVGRTGVYSTSSRLRLRAITERRRLTAPRSQIARPAPMTNRCRPMIMVQT